MEVNYFLGNMGCNYYLDFTECNEPDEEGNYNQYVRDDRTRLAAHVGTRPFSLQSGQVI